MPARRPRGIRKPRLREPRESDELVRRLQRIESLLETEPDESPVESRRESAAPGPALLDPSPLFLQQSASPQLNELSDIPEQDIVSQPTISDKACQSLFPIEDPYD